MKKNFIYVFAANIVSLVIGILTNFMLPKFLSIESYAYMKTYALYISYAGFFSLGYNDGMYLKYGGKKIGEIGKKDIGDNIFNYTILEVVMTSILLIVGVIIKKKLVVAFSIGMLATNMSGYLKSLYQATGEMKLYGKALNLEKILIFLLNLLLLFVFCTDNYYFYILIQIIVGLLVTTILLWEIQKKYKFLFVGKFSVREYYQNIKSGIILMLGNFSSTLFTGIDRWFVKFFMATSDFALYSFAVSLENIITVFITMSKDSNVSSFIIQESPIFWPARRPSLKSFLTTPFPLQST